MSDFVNNKNTEVGDIVFFIGDEEKYKILHSWPFKVSGVKENTISIELEGVPKEFPLKDGINMFVKKAKKWTLVIGAGAHFDYGYPTGAMLKNFIRSLANQYSVNGIEREAISLIKKLKHSIKLEVLSHKEVKLFDVYAGDLDTNENFDIETMLSDFLEAFVGTGDETIDSFLADNKYWAPFGKLLIAGAIRFYEVGRFDSVNKSEDNWIQELCRRYLPSGEKLHLSKVLANFPNVITFNYDRLLEEVIYRRLVFKFNLNEYDANIFIEQLPIHHVYGKVGDTRFKSLRKYPYRGLFEASKSLLVIGEDRDKKVEHDLILKLVKKSDALAFIGFGFDETNTKLIFGESDELSIYGKIGGLSEIVGTAIGVPTKRKYEVQEWTNNIVAFGRYFESSSCYNLFRDKID